MKITLAFDVYGTLIDTKGVTTKLREFINDDAPAFANLWRTKQLEYSFRKGLMRDYENFSICIKQSLKFTCQYFKLTLTPDQENELLNSYKTLPAYDDAKSCLESLNNSEFKNYAFTNGTIEAVQSLLYVANIREYFIDIISVDEIKSFKPNPDVYQYFFDKTGSESGSTYLISSNPFDVIGAMSAKMKAIWVKRDQNNIYDPWDIEPTAIVNDLNELKSLLEKID